ncbi:MAG TPA: NADH-quinone oxidoreductase subunit H, partial [Polyangiaceae bacterium]|nr:NADH-quinone oxidoreductase subunit H [Polyangiaceae bacterium]
FMFAEFIEIAIIAALFTTLFLGGYNLPYMNDGGFVFPGNHAVPLPHGLVVVIQLVVFLAKVLLISSFQILIRWTLPRFRYDQLMQLGWRKLLPASLVNILATGIGVMVLQGAEGSLAMGLRVLCDASTLLVGLVMAGLLVWFVVFLLKPVHKRPMLASTSAQFAAAMGGTRNFRMES